jgi:hypothetical protein
VVVLGLYNLMGVLQNSYFLCEEKGDFEPITLNIFCHNALLELEEVRKDKEWMCPHCVEETGFNPYWICNRYRSQSLKIFIS